MAMACRSMGTSSLVANLASGSVCRSRGRRSGPSAFCRFGLGEGREEAGGHPLDGGGGRVTVIDQGGAPRQRCAVNMVEGERMLAAEAEIDVPMPNTLLATAR